jgi:hypothetical protein
MKKILSFLLIMIPMLVIVTSCNNSASNMGPKEVLAAFFEKLSQKDIEGASKLATKDSKSTLDMMKKGLEMAEKMKDQADPKEDPAAEFKDVEIGEAKINGDVATVPVKNKKKGEEIEMPLKKEDGAWKVDFSMTTLMKMGAEQREKKGLTDDDMDSGMEGMDSVKIRQGLEMADSMLKNMDPEKIKQMQEAMEKLKEQK